MCEVAALAAVLMAYGDAHSTTMGREEVAVLSSVLHRLADTASGLRRAYYVGWGERQLAPPAT